MNIYPEGEALEILVTKYSESHRHYHTWDHIVYMLNEYADLVDNGDVPFNMAQVYAIWFHDFVFDPLAPDNEIRSALCATNYLHAIGVEENTILTVQKIIIDSKWPHKASIEESKVVLDLDLLAFSEPMSEYKINQENIRKEYDHLSQVDWVAGRIKFLEEVRSRDPFFYTPLYHEHAYSSVMENTYNELQSFAESKFKIV